MRIRSERSKPYQSSEKNYFFVSHKYFLIWKVLPLVGADLIGRLMVQCSIEPGLAACFHDILAFEVRVRVRVGVRVRVRFSRYSGFRGLFITLIHSRAL